MEFFIELGADLEEGNPLAFAYCNRIRTALRIFKKYKVQFPSLQEQANIALRYHCKEGNMKWVSLMLWVGADPYSAGPSDWDEDIDAYPEEQISALEYAALYGHLEIFKMKSVRLRPDQDNSIGLLQYAAYNKSADILEYLLDRGFWAEMPTEDGSTLMQGILERLGARYSHGTWFNDSPVTREKMKMLHLLAKKGAKWLPQGQQQVNSVRRSLLQVSPEYTLELLWLASQYEFATKETMLGLLNTTTILSHLTRHKSVFEELKASLAKSDASHEI